MILILGLFILQCLGYINLDSTGIIDIYSDSSNIFVKTSSPGTGFVWYLLSEQEEKLTVVDADGTYTSGNPGYQNFTAVCNTKCLINDQIKLTLILKRPWENSLSVIKTIFLNVVAK